MNKLISSVSPHINSPRTTQKIMLDVLIALLPACVASVIIFGWRSLLIIGVCVAVCILSEWIFEKICKKENTIFDLSAVVTGVLLAYNLPVSIPLWQAAFGSMFAIVVVKQLFGGIGQNFANPAITARIILLLSFAKKMGDWTAPLSWRTDAVSTATPLASLASGETEGLPSMLDMFLGVRAGSLGETCALALIVGGIYLVARKVISPAIPLSFIGTVAVIMLIAGKGNLEFVAYQLMGGGLLLGAIFMATDYSTSPISFAGKIVFGIGCGILASLIRLFASMPEGVSFAILIMNLLVPHIEALTKPKPFGTVKEEKTKEAAAK